jgi:deoxycytidylate deaminase
MKYLNVALDNAEKSFAKYHKHGAVCILGGRVVSVGYNEHTLHRTLLICGKRYLYSSLLFNRCGYNWFIIRG